MRAGKAYISSLGTTGLLIASSLLLLTVVGAMLAFDRWPANAATDTHVVSIAAESPQRDAGASRAAAALDLGSEAGSAVRGGPRSGPAASVPSAAGSAVAVQVGADSATLVKTPPVADPVVSDLPAPDAAPQAGGSAAAPAPAPAPEQPSPPSPSLPGAGDVIEMLPAPGADGGLTGVTEPVAESVGTLSPSIGDTVDQTGTAVDTTVGGVLELTGR